MRFLSCFLLFVALVSCAVRAEAQSNTQESYEWERTKRLLDKLKLSVDDAPEGKKIAFVKVVRDEVFVPDEIWPEWWNWFHGKTRERIIRRELLFEEGKPLVYARIEETMRNLRGMGIFALVRIVAVHAQNPDEVGIVVHTRDIWSLRIEEDFRYTTFLDTLLIRLTERNLAGMNQTIGADYTLLPKTYQLSEFYEIRRLFASTVRFEHQGAIIFNRDHNKAEGVDIYAYTGEPFYNLKQRFAWTVEGEVDSRVARQLQQRNVLLYQPGGPGTPAALRVWRQKQNYANAVAYYRRGQTFKQTFGAGWDYRSLSASPNHETQLPPELRDSFEKHVLPKQRIENGPFLNYEIWVPQWTTFVNLGSYGQSENVRVGPHASVAVRAPLSQFGSTTYSWVVSGDIGVVLAPGGGLFEIDLSGKERFEEGKVDDQLFTAMMRGATPVFAKLRFVARAFIESRRRDTTKQLVSLGANNGLRGYTSQYFFGYGASRMLANFELRTLPIKWEAVHVGAVVFYDVGSVFSQFSAIKLHQAAGVGIRVVFPQFDREPYTFDAGMSADPDFRFVPTFTSGQIVPMTAYEDAN